MKTYTIPAAVLDQLGSLRPEDPPVLLGAMRAEHNGPQWRTTLWHPAASSITWAHPADPSQRVVLPASSAAVAAVLARAVGHRRLDLGCHALALAACWVARVRRYEKHTTEMAHAVVLPPSLETIQRYEQANGWDAWEVESASRAVSTIRALMR